MYEITSHCTGVGNTDYNVAVNHAIADRGLAPYPGFFWYVEGQGRKILVDTGRPNVEEMREALGGDEYVPEQDFVGGEEEVRRQLRERHGVEPDEIDAVICTHLHADHIPNIGLFPDATVYVQRDELIHAIDPAPHQRFGYARDVTAKITNRKQPDELRIMDGDYEVAPGIDVYKTPGHTPGFQTAAIQTDKGTVGVYLSKKYANWFPAAPEFGFPVRHLQDTFNVEGVHTESSWTYLESMERMAEVCDVVLPGHEPFMPRNLPEEWYFTDPTAPSPSADELETFREVRDRVKDDVIVGDPTKGMSKEWEFHPDA